MTALVQSDLVRKGAIDRLDIQDIVKELAQLERPPRQGLELRLPSALELPSGSWEVTVVTAQPAPEVHLSVTPTAREGWIVASERGSATLFLEGDEPSRIDLRVRVGGARRSFSVREIQLERRPLDW